MASVTSYAQALHAFNAVMWADPLQRQLASGARWGDVMFMYDLRQARQPVCPWAPKKPAAPARAQEALDPAAPTKKSLELETV